jgi:hypothetical protein
MQATKKRTRERTSSKTFRSQLYRERRGTPRTRTVDPQVYGEPTYRLGYGDFCCLYAELGSFEPPFTVAAATIRHSLQHYDSNLSSIACREAHKDPQYAIHTPRYPGYPDEVDARMLPSAVRAQLFIEASGAFLEHVSYPNARSTFPNTLKKRCNSGFTHNAVERPKCTECDGSFSQHVATLRSSGKAYRQYLDAAKPDDTAIESQLSKHSSAPRRRPGNQRKQRAKNSLLRRSRAGAVKVIVFN